MSTSTENLLAEGAVVFESGPIEGVLHVLSNPAEVLALVEEEVDGIIVLVAKQGATFLGPLLPAVSGIICTAGTPRSHLGIVSREWQIPCLMGATLTGGMPESGIRVRLDCSHPPTGALERLPED